MQANQSLCVCYSEQLGAVSRRKYPKPQPPVYFLWLYTINPFSDACSDAFLKQQAQGRALSLVLTPNPALGLAPPPVLMPPPDHIQHQNQPCGLWQGSSSSLFPLWVPVCPCLMPPGWLLGQAQHPAPPWELVGITVIGNPIPLCRQAPCPCDTNSSIRTRRLPGGGLVRKLL